MLAPLQASRGDRLVVGLTGYPNVGKSSTINALFGSKKTAVAPTPGKTKHFQVGSGGQGGLMVSVATVGSRGRKVPWCELCPARRLACMASSLCIAPA